MRRLLIVLAACSSTPAPGKPAAGPSACEKVGDHLIGLMTAGFTGADRPTEAIDRLTRVIIELCSAGWSPDAQQCFLGVRSLSEDAEAWDRCAGYLTVEQRDALPKAIDAAFAKQPAS